MPFCPSCGNEIETQWNFCLHCGTNVSEVTEVISDSAPEVTDDERGSKPKLLLELDRAVFKEKIRSMDPYDFEKLVGKIWRYHGWKVDVSQKSQDRGIDINAEKANKIELIQVKRYGVNNKIGSNEVRKYATLYQQETDVNSVVIATSSSFTSQATELAVDLGVKAVDSDNLYEMVQNTDIKSSELNTSPEQQNSNKYGSLEPQNPNKYESPEQFGNIYQDFIELNTEMAKEVMQPASRAANHDGAEAQFALNGGREQLRFSIQMRNEWVKIITKLQNITNQMNSLPDRMPQSEFTQLISEQIETMYNLSEAYKRGLSYKDKLINSRFETKQISPGTLSQVEIPNAPILSEPVTDVKNLKHEQDVCMTIAAKETGKIGDLSEERRRLIDMVKNQT